MRRESPITYGIDSPEALLKKLYYDSSRIEREDNQPYDIFNFIITCSILWEWVTKHYSHLKSRKLESIQKAINIKNTDETLIPVECISWFSDKSVFPQKEADLRKDVIDVLQICNFTANASKHYVWNASNPVKAVTTEPQISDLYQYFFTSTKDDLYLTIRGKHYALYQVRGIIIQFFEGLISELETKNT